MVKKKQFTKPRDMRAEDLEQLPELHRNCFSGSVSLFSILGDYLIKCYYKQAMEEDISFAAVLEETVSGKIMGLALGTIIPGFQQRFLKRYFLPFCWDIFKRLFVSKDLWKLLWMRVIGKSGLQLAGYDSDLKKQGIPEPMGTEVLFMLVGVQTQFRGGGNAEKLVSYFAARAFKAGVQRIRGTIHLNNLASIILFKKLGWNFKKISDTQVSVWIGRPDLNF